MFDEKAMSLIPTYAQTKIPHREEATETMFAKIMNHAAERIRVSFRRKWGILIIGAAAIVESLSLPTGFLNIFLYGSSVNACLTSDIVTLLTCIAVSVAWALFYNILGTKILSKSDVY